MLSPRDLVSRPDNIDETVLHTHSHALNTDCGERRLLQRDNMCMEFFVAALHVLLPLESLIKLYIIYFSLHSYTLSL